MNVKAKGIKWTSHLLKDVLLPINMDSIINKLMVKAYTAGHTEGTRTANKKNPFRTPKQIANDLRGK